MFENYSLIANHIHRRVVVNRISYQTHVRIIKKQPFSVACPKKHKQKSENMNLIRKTRKTPAICFFLSISG